MKQVTKTVQNVSDRFTKDMRIMKRYQREILDIKNCIKFINCNNDQCENRVSEIKDKVVNYFEVLRETSKKIRE